MALVETRWLLKSNSLEGTSWKMKTKIGCFVLVMGVVVGYEKHKKKVFSENRFAWDT